VWEPSGSPGDPKWVTGLATGYKEGDTAAFEISVTITPAQLGQTLEFGIVLDLTATSGATAGKYAFDKFSTLNPFNATVSPTLSGTPDGQLNNVTALIPSGGSPITFVSVSPTPTVDFSGSVATEEYFVDFVASQTGTYFFLTGGHLAKPGDIVHTASGTTVVGPDSGAHFAGNFQLRVDEVSGAHTIPFKGSLIQIPTADIAVSKTDGTTSVVAGTADTYTITVTNNGPLGVSSLSLSDTIPAALTGASFGTPSSGTFNSTTDVWTINLASGASATITLSGTVSPTASGSLV